MKVEDNVDSLIDSAFENQRQESIVKMLDAYELNWKIVKIPLIRSIDIADKIINPHGEESGIKSVRVNKQTATPFYSIEREDTHQTFWASRKSYEPFQNYQLAELLYKISERTGYELHGGGELSGGAKVFLQLNTGEENGIGENRDTIRKFVTALNSHDGQTAMRWGLTNITISCSNTFNAAYRQLKSSVRHTATMHKRLEASLQEIEVLNKVEELMFTQIRVLASKPMVQKSLVNVVKSVVGVDMTLSQEQLQNEYKTYTLTRLGELLSAIQQETAEKGSTLWGLFSGVTKYTSHVMPSGKKHGARVESKYIGNGYKIDNNAFQMISAM